MQVQEAISVDFLVENSLNQYMEMKDLLLQLKGQLENNSVEWISSFLDKFNELGEESRKTDKLILKYLYRPMISAELKEKLEQRNVMQADILAIIEKTVPQAKSVKSFLANEVSSIRRGRSAMKGYRSGALNQGRIVNKNG